MSILMILTISKFMPLITAYFPKENFSPWLPTGSKSQHPSPRL